MADINLSAVIGGGGDFSTRFASTAVILASGQSGTFITLTPPSRQRVRLTGLQLNAGTEANISIDIGAENVIVNKTLTAGSTNIVDNFYVGQNSNNGRAGTYLWLTGKLDEVITITKTSGSTTNTTQYAYEFGE